MWPPFAVLTQLVMSKTHSLGNIGCGCSNMNGIIRSLFWVAHSPVSHWKDKILIRSSTTGHTLISGCYNNIFFIVFVSKMLFVSKASTLECGGCYLLCLLFSFKICYLFIKRLPPFWKTPARSDVLPISLTLPEVIKLGSSFFTLVIESSTSSWMWSIPITFPLGPTCNAQKECQCTIYSRTTKSCHVPCHFLLIWCRNHQSMCLPVKCGSPFVRSKLKGCRCQSPRQGLWLPRTAGHVEAPGHRHAGWVRGK